MKRTEQGCYEFENRPSVTAFAAVGGKLEGEGPLGGKFDRIFTDSHVGESSWELAESRLLHEAVTLCMDKDRHSAQEYDAVFSGDLLNQCVASTFGLRGFKTPSVGMFGACSTMALTLINAAVFLDACPQSRCIAATSSHFSSAERQFRTPLQYGGQRTPTAQWTATAAGAVAIGQNDGKRSIRINRAAIGIAGDMGIKDSNNMGAAMAPVSVKLTP